MTFYYKIKTVISPVLYIHANYDRLRTLCNTSLVPTIFWFLTAMYKRFLQLNLTAELIFENGLKIVYRLASSSRNRTVNVFPSALQRWNMREYIFKHDCLPNISLLFALKYSRFVLDANNYRMQFNTRCLLYGRIFSNYLTFYDVGAILKTYVSFIGFRGQGEDEVIANTIDLWRHKELYSRGSRRGTSEFRVLRYYIYW